MKDILPPRPIFAVVMPDGTVWTTHRRRELAEKACRCEDASVVMRVVEYAPKRIRRKQP